MDSIDRIPALDLISERVTLFCLMFWLWAACTLVFVYEQVVGQLAIMLNGLSDDQWSTLPHAWLE